MTTSSKVPNVDAKVKEILEKHNRKVDLTNEIQTEIDPNVYFNRNSVNLLVGKKGSGKTYNVFREVLKLNYIKNHHYTKMLYVTSNPEDNTYQRFESLLKIPIDKVSYDEAVDAINDVIEAKSAIKQLQRGEVTWDEIDDEAKEELQEVLGDEVKTDKKRVYHSIVLLDDCAFLFDKKNKHNQDLFRMLLQNRQPNITYFLTMQDPKGFDTALKEALDSCWVFGGFTHRKFGYLCSYIPHGSTPYKLWNMYKKMTRNQAILFKIDMNETKIIEILN